MSASEIASVLPQTWEALPQLKFDVMRPSDVKEVTEFILKDYFSQFPLVDNISFDVDNEIRPWLSDYVQHVAKKDTSLVVRKGDEKDCIVATILNNITYRKAPRGEMSQVAFADPEKRPVWTKICRLIEDVHHNIEFHQDPVISMEFVTVKKELTHRGLASKCVEISIEMARKLGIKTITAEVANEYLYKCLVKEGFEIVHDINLNCYIQKDEKPFATPTIHNRIRLLCKCID